MDFFQSIENADRELFLLLNGFNNHFFDVLMAAVSNRFTWIPLYILFVFFLYKQYSFKHLSVILLLVAGLIFTSDQCSVLLFKNLFARYRPCHNEEIKQFVHVVDSYCGGKYGFISSHASNFSALSVFLLFVFRNVNSKTVFMFTAWVLLISYSRIYLGVHYPADVFAGILFGSLLGFIFAFICKKIIQ
jgi:undecaprenyl-diphosphatase